MQSQPHAVACSKARWIPPTVETFEPSTAFLGSNATFLRWLSGRSLQHGKRTRNPPRAIVAGSKLGRQRHLPALIPVKALPHRLVLVRLEREAQRDVVAIGTVFAPVGAWCIGREVV